MGKYLANVSLLRKIHGALHFVLYNKRLNKQEYNLQFDCNKFHCLYKSFDNNIESAIKQY